ncbi:MAG: c-type cytochrome [Magnetospirillum sp.]|nr:MAG: c-type cytochrome [Magnetospirillum sp.]
MSKKFLMLALGAAIFAAPAMASEDAPKAFNACKACHKTEAGKNGVGPSLFGVVGRKSGTGEGFKYSDAMKNAPITWDAASLSTYLADPKKTVPGNKMAFAGLKKADEVKEVVEYLGKLK